MRWHEYMKSEGFLYATKFSYLETSGTLSTSGEKKHCESDNPQNYLTLASWFARKASTRNCR